MTLLSPVDLQATTDSARAQDAPRVDAVGGVSAFVLDDDLEYGAVIASVLSVFSNVVVATSPEDALHSLPEHPSDVVVIERFAVRGLVELLTLVRALREPYPNIAIVVTSRERLLVAEVVACFEAGVDEYILKPFHPSEFAARVRRLLPSTTQSREAAA